MQATIIISTKIGKLDINRNSWLNPNPCFSMKEDKVWKRLLDKEIT